MLLTSLSLTTATVLMGSLDNEADSDGPGFQLNKKSGPSSLLLWPCLSELCGFLPWTALDSHLLVPRLSYPLSTHSLARLASILLSTHNALLELSMCSALFCTLGLCPSMSCWCPTLSVPSGSPFHQSHLSAVLSSLMFFITE